MLNWLIDYLKNNGYHFHDSYQPNYNGNNYSSYNNESHQTNAVPSRRQRKRRSNRNRKIQAEAQNRKALEAVNLKKGLETKIEAKNKGYELPVKMGIEKGKGLVYSSYNNESHQTNAAPSRRQRMRRSNMNRKIQAEAQNRKALEAVNLKKGLETKIEANNKGYELLVKMGYENGKGLGRNAEGILEPLSFEKKSDRKGLGTPVHSKAVDTHLSKTQVNNKKAKAEEQVSQKLNIRAQANKKVVVATPKHTPKVKGYAEVDKKSVVLATALSQDSKQKLIVALPEQAASAKNTPKTKNSQNFKENINKDNFSIKDPCTPEFILSLARAFYSEIELMQSRLLEEASLNIVNTDTQFFVVKIYIEDNANIDDNLFEFIRCELVGWIGTYQHEGMDTPIFHSMANNNSYITIVCENKYAFDCLDRCVEDILQMKTMGSLKIVLMPPITPLIYCFDAKYEGIASDPGLFLKQLHLHKPKLYSDGWVVVYHKVCPEERKTYFILLIDERSALALNFHYSRSFFICMQQVTFRSRGIVKESI